MFINCIVSISWLSAPPSWLGYRYYLLAFNDRHTLSKWLTLLSWNHIAEFVEIFVTFLAFSKQIWRLNRPDIKDKSSSNLETSHFSTYSSLHLCHKQILILLKVTHSTDDFSPLWTYFGLTAHLPQTPQLVTPKTCWIRHWVS